MDPLPANNTDRWFLDYVTGSAATAKEHTVSLRLGPAGGVDGATSFLLTLLQGIGAANLFVGWKPLRLRHQAAGTDFSIPSGLGATLGAFVGTGSVSGFNTSQEAVEATFQARSMTTGRRCDLSLYGIKQQVTDFRFAAGAGPAWNTPAFYAALNGLGQPGVAIDGSALTWYPYVNFNYNSYWEGQLRRG